MKYSEPLYKEIEAYLMRYFGTISVVQLEDAIKNQKGILADLERFFDQIEDAIDNAETERSSGSYQRLLSALFMGMMQNILPPFDIGGLEDALRYGSREEVGDVMESLRGLTEKVRSSATKKLRNDAKEMRENLKEWQPYYSDEALQELLDHKQQGTWPTLTIDLKPEHFPFLGEKFRRAVKKARGADAEIFDDFPHIKVVLARLGKEGALGMWAGNEKTLIIAPPALAPKKRLQNDLFQAITHELRHATQSILASALGIKQIKMDEGEVFPVYQPGPGMVSRKLMNPELLQGLIGHPDKDVENKRNELMQAHQLEEPAAIYNLDDLEFYTHLADRVMLFERYLDDFLKDKTPQEQRFARDLYTARTKVPRDVKKLLKGRSMSSEREKAAQEWIDKHDPRKAILAMVRGPDMFFAHTKKKPGRWQKALKEFYKATEDKLKSETPKAEEGTTKSLGELWKEFLDERYDGGKEKVTNPNPDTRGSHPEISVSYLIKQTDPVYQPGRQRIRREFAQWRSQKAGPQQPQQPSAPSSSPGWFDEPPG